LGQKFWLYIIRLGIKYPLPRKIPIWQKMIKIESTKIPITALTFFLLKPR
jgi:hypothetical protein